MSDTMKRMWTERQVRGMAVDSVEEKEKLKVFEHIVDKDGHKRFIEGDITIKTLTGVTQTYGKWSLSGTHLMIVICYSVTNGTEVDYTSDFAILSNLPAWILEKITPLGSTYVSFSSFNAFGNDDSTQSVNAQLRVLDSNLRVSQSSFTASKDRNVRLQFDLLIDNE